MTAYSTQEPSPPSASRARVDESRAQAVERNHIPHGLAPKWAARREQERKTVKKQKAVVGTLAAMTLVATLDLASGQTPYARLDLVAVVDSPPNETVEQSECLDLGGYVLAWIPHDDGGGSVRLELQDDDWDQNGFFLIQEGLSAPAWEPFNISVGYDPPCVDLEVSNSRVRIYRLNALVDWANTEQPAAQP